MFRFWLSKMHFFLPTTHIPGHLQELLSFAFLKSLFFDRFSNANSIPLRSLLPVPLCSNYKGFKLGPFKVISKNWSYFLNLILVSAYLEFHLGHFLEKKGCKRPKYKTESQKSSLNAIKRALISLDRNLDSEGRFK